MDIEYKNMEEMIRSMYDNKIKLITPPDVEPFVAVSNHISVRESTVWGPRVISDFELILVIKGTFSYDADDHDTEIVSEGEILCIYPRVRHVLRRCDKETAKGEIACLHFELRRDGMWSAGDYQLDPMPEVVTNVSGQKRIHEIFISCARTYGEESPYRVEILGTMAKELWLRLCECWGKGGERFVSERMRLMLDYIKENLSTTVSRRDLAKRFHVTPEYVNALFKKELGMSPTEYRHRQRIYEACRLMVEEGLSVKETAETVGYYDEFHFSKVFKRIQGYTPRVLKQKFIERRLISIDNHSL